MHRAKVLDWLAALGAVELAEDHEVTLPQLAPHHWQQLHSNSPMTMRPKLDRWACATRHTTRTGRQTRPAPACLGHSRAGGVCARMVVRTCAQSMLRPQRRCRRLPANACRNYTSWKEDTGVLPGEHDSVGLSTLLQHARLCCLSAGPQRQGCVNVVAQQSQLCQQKQTVIALLHAGQRCSVLCRWTALQALPPRG